jgi:hypothetical protein
MSETTKSNPANVAEVRAVVTTFADTADKDTTTARKARLVHAAMQVASLAIIAEAVAERFSKRGITAGVPSKGTLSNYAKAWEYAAQTGVTDDVTVARLFTTISASAVKAADLKAQIATIASMPEGERSDALNGIPTARSARPKATASAPADVRKGEGDDATTDAAGSEAVTVAAVAHGIGVLAQRIREGDLSKAEVKQLVAAWRKVVTAIESGQTVETVAEAIAV